jgi:hypothetical protein
MRSLIFITLTLFISSPLLAQDWTGISDCGVYQVNAVARSVKSGLVIIVNEKTKSEITISVPVQNEAFLAPYVDKAMSASVVFSKKAQGSKAEGSIKDIKSRIPNPINPMDTGIKLISKARCK